MSHPAVRIERLGKRYRLGEQNVAYETLRDQLAQVFNGFWRGRPPSPNGWFWALKDVSLEIAAGEAVAIIGRNGSGKSTLLNILSRITVPTEGRAQLYGRVASLLEIGTGFHSELTGRENIYVNGAVLGMTPRDIKRKFDAIVAFAELERFIDTPVKRYSSGMWLRLAFAVAAHVEPEILLIDEVMSVGDAAFQKKCLGSMGDAHRAGRTVLFVSHDMQTVSTLATRAVWLDSGRVIDQGPSDDIITRYLANVPCDETGEFDLARIPRRRSEYSPIITRLTLFNGKGRPTARFAPDAPFVAEITVDPATALHNPRLNLTIDDSLGRRITTVAPHFHDWELGTLGSPCRIRCTVPRLALGVGRYFISLVFWMPPNSTLDDLECVASFEIDTDEGAANWERGQPVHGPVLTDSIWERLPA